MHRSLLMGILLAAFCAAGSLASDAYFQQDVQYTIRARLDTDGRMLLGTETILYTNNSPDTLRHFYLHLYPNAYKSKDTAFQKSYRRYYNVNLFNLPGAYRGYIDIDTLSVDGQAVAARIEDTIAKIDLPQPLLPGGSIRLSLSFREKIRKQIGRAGYRGEQFDITQWYPKVVVYDQNRFHADPFELGEFYGEFGTFDVHLEVPDNYVVAATGEVRDGDPGWNLHKTGGGNAGGTGGGSVTADGNSGAAAYKTVHFHADKVHDFAWSASPDFAVQDTTWNGVQILSFYKDSNRQWQDSTLVHGVRALTWLEEKVGPYPYPQLSIVQSLADGGMEYPMLVMNGTVSEPLVLHEAGHIYFYGALANDERQEAWLDEGATSAQTAWYLQERYGPWGKKDDWSLHQK
ncbi:MAG: M1 family metallopeptidase [Candidatus Latescibacterota bacterium]